MYQEGDWSGRYRRVMEALWHFPDNDQRPAVLAALRNWCEQGQRVLDIGAGDGYYLKELAPRLVTAVEPDQVLQYLAQKQSASLGCPVVTLGSIDELRRGVGAHWHADLTLMVHVLYYLEESELRWLLPRVRQYDLLLVYPDPAAAVTVAFEDVLGSRRSRRRVAIKSALLGEPRETRLADTHFRLQPDTPVEDLAFLVAHLPLRGKPIQDVMHTARTFVADRMDTWRRDSFLELPQPQIMEFYSGAVLKQ